MKLGLNLKTSLSQTLTPQQIQYLKLLQLPMIQLEQHVQQAIEENPMLEEVAEEDIPSDDPETDAPDSVDDFDSEIDDDFDSDLASSDKDIHIDSNGDASEDFDDDEFYEPIDYKDEPIKIDEEQDPFEFNKLLTQDDSEFTRAPGNTSKDDDNSEGFQIKDTGTFAQDLVDQLRLLDIEREEFLLGTNIIWNLDDDGYLRRDLREIIDETNSQIAEYNFTIQQQEYTKSQAKQGNSERNPAKRYELSNESKDTLAEAQRLIEQLNETGRITDYLARAKPRFNYNADTKRINDMLIRPLEHESGEKVLKIVQELDPPGIAARNIQECLSSQLRSRREKTPSQLLALDILENEYDSFVKKHFDAIKKKYRITDDTLRAAIEEITTLNPKPGGGDYRHEMNTVIPDYVVIHDEDSEDLLVSVNDSRMPQLRLNKAYEALKKEAKQRNFNKDTRVWLRNKHEDAKFLIQAIRQRKNTMLKVMTAITALQREFFEIGKAGLRPLIYKDVAEATGLDISTVCRIVNGKYVQTEFGTFELKFFFSEALPSDEGEEISTTVIKDELKRIIDSEPKDRPYSDDKIGKELKALGYNVARRTVAKYREQLRIPVARLRKELV